jgi:hypothetical protein
MKFTPSTPKASHDPVPTIVTRRLWTSDWSSADAHSDPTPVVALSNANHSAVLQGEPCGPTRMLTRAELLFGLRFILRACILTLVAVDASAVDCAAIANVRPRVAIARQAQRILLVLCITNLPCRAARTPRDPKHSMIRGDCRASRLRSRGRPAIATVNIGGVTTFLARDLLNRTVGTISGLEWC